MSKDTHIYKNLIGSRIDHFLIEEEIGSGAMGIVYLALDEKLNRKVALKVLKMDVIDPNSDLYQRFKTEAQTMAQLNHPNIIKIYSYNITKDFTYIEMEYIEGHKLSDLIYDDKLSYRVAINLMYIICKAIQYLHENNILHRDIKPSNIMITSSKELKIIDFGLSKDLKLNHITKSGSILGTPLYMSLECLESNNKVSEKSDVYSLGVLFYEMLTRHFPYFGDTESDLYKSILLNNPIDVTDYNINIHIEISYLIKAMLKKDYNIRISLNDVILILEKHINFSIPCEYYEKNMYKSKILSDLADKSTIILDDYQNENEIINVSNILYESFIKNEKRAITLLKIIALITVILCSIFSTLILYNFY